MTNISLETRADHAAEQVPWEPGPRRPIYAAMGCFISLFATHCSSVCEPGTSCNEDMTAAELQADLTAAPADPAAGDERAGYVTCSNAATGESVTCTGDGVGCCSSPTPTCGTYDTCFAANNNNPMLANYQECDGPEDCSAGEYCWLERGGTMCAVSGGHVMKCHVDSDCPGEHGACDSGECSVAPAPDAMQMAGG